MAEIRYDTLEREPRPSSSLAKVGGQGPTNFGGWRLAGETSNKISCYNHQKETMEMGNIDRSFPFKFRGKILVMAVLPFTFGEPSKNEIRATTFPT